MRVLYLTQYYPPTIGAGAVRSATMVRTWAKRGWDIDVVTEYPVYPMGERSSQASVNQADEELPDSVHVARLPAREYDPSSFSDKLRNQLTFLWLLLLHMLKHPRRYDLIYVSSPPIFPAFGGMILKRLLQTRLTVELRDVWPDAIAPHSPLGQSPWVYRVLKYLEKLLYNQADRIVTVTPETTRMIQPLRNGTPVSMIRNGVDDQTFAPRESIKEVEDDRFVVGYVGSFASQHDLETLLHAAQLCAEDPDIVFHIIGSGKREQEFRALREKYAQANINWLGLQSHEQIPRHIRQFDLAVNPIIESQATRSSVTVKFYEYLACGVPIINSAQGAAEELGEQSGAVITIKPADPQLLATTIRELKQDPEQVDRMKQSALSYFKNNWQSYSRNYQAEQLADVLHTECIYSAGDQPTVDPSHANR
jgi:colanic acid biosynthesis glycosyl transferase WcaI